MERTISIDSKDGKTQIEIALTTNETHHGERACYVNTDSCSSAKEAKAMQLFEKRLEQISPLANYESSGFMVGQEKKTQLAVSFMIPSDWEANQQRGNPLYDKKRIEQLTGSVFGAEHRHDGDKQVEAIAVSSIVLMKLTGLINEHQAAKALGEMGCKKPYAMLKDTARRCFPAQNGIAIV